ncbi:MAG: DUF1569 domain-containing protein [Chitinophagaceae bacterium]|nr:DUF1569 domain-containing protein [Chitinophagaceae bacterium]
MEIKNLFDPVVKQEIVSRINKLTPQSQRQWGKMNVSQMLAHLQPAIKIAYGTHKPKGHFFFKLILPFFKSKLWDEKPYKKGLPTDTTFIMTGTEKDFEKEKTAVIELIGQFTESNIKGERHPVFGKMTKENWSKAMWKHIDHHLCQFGV